MAKVSGGNSVRLVEVQTVSRGYSLEAKITLIAPRSPAADFKDRGFFAKLAAGAADRTREREKAAKK